MNETLEQHILKNRHGLLSRFNIFRLIFRMDKVILSFILIAVSLALTAPDQVLISLQETGLSLVSVGPFILLSVLLAAYIKASGLDHQIARIFSQSPVKSIILASVLGGLSPFCSCGVIPLIAGLLVSGVPLAPVMAFWIASPLMDPEMFILTTAVLGLDFALVKTFAAIGMALLAGFTIHSLRQTSLFQTVLREDYSRGCNSGGGAGNTEITLRFWQDSERLNTFWQQSGATGYFLFKWLAVAFLLESIMINYLPAEMIADNLSGDQWWAIPASTLVGIPAYMNGYAALPMMSALLEKGMDPGAGLAFIIAGGATSIPAAMAVFSLVRKKVFFAYISFALVGALLSGLLLGPLL